jgi:hypothetical protein
MSVQTHQYGYAQQAREKIPFLHHFINDWATINLVAQYMKNKRNHLYSIGQPEVSEKYAYLKDNASKCDPTGSHKKRALVSSGTSVSRRGKTCNEIQQHKGSKLNRPNIVSLLT